LTCPSCGGAITESRQRGGMEAAVKLVRCKGCGTVLRERHGSLYPVDPDLKTVGRAEELGTEEPPLDPLGALASEQGLPFIENAPAVRIAPWANRIALGMAIVMGIGVHLNPALGDALELSADHQGVRRFLTHALLPSQATGLALSDLYLLLLFGGVVEEALGTIGYVAMYAGASILGGWLSLAFLPEEHVRGFTAAVVAMSSFFCLSYPSAKIGFRLGLPGQRSFIDSWIRFPPLVWLLFWFILHVAMQIWAVNGRLPQQKDFLFLAAPWVGGACLGAVAWLARLMVNAPRQND
jgi:membrane associated rhomboid family serine protease